MHRRRLGLTPLIDVIFLLLLFFMLSSTFSRFSDLSLGRIAAETSRWRGQKVRHRSFYASPPTRCGSIETAFRSKIDPLITTLGEGDILVSLQDGTDSQRLVDVLARPCVRSRGDA